MSSGKNATNTNKNTHTHTHKHTHFTFADYQQTQSAHEQQRRDCRLWHTPITVGVSALERALAQLARERIRAGLLGEAEPIVEGRLAKETDKVRDAGMGDNMVRLALIIN